MVVLAPSKVPSPSGAFPSGHSLIISGACWAERVAVKTEKMAKAVWKNRLIVKRVA